MREIRLVKSTRVITATMALPFLLLTTLYSTGRVPPPSETPARMIVNGRTSTAIDIKIVKVGQELPDTLSAPMIKSISGYDWYVSEHFALRSEVDEKQSRDYLTMSELAYPHFVWIFGGEPPEIKTKRIALSFSKSLQRLKAASDVDVGGVGWRGGGGGVTLHVNRVSYNYPGGGLRSHKRGLVMHENLHAFHMHRAGRTSDDLPVWFYEGITHAFEQHVYDPEKRQLTVMVLDRVSGNNYTDSGLSYLREDFVEAEQFWLGKEGMGYVPPVYQLWMQFLWSDLDRQMRHRVWLNERMARDLNVPKDEFDKAMPDLNEAIRLDPRFSEALDHRAYVHLKRGNLDQALADFDEAIRFGPAYSWSYTGRARAYFQKRVFDKAIADFSKAFEIERGGNKLTAGYGLSLGCLANRDIRGYRTACARMLEHFADSENPEHYRWLAWNCVLAPDALDDYSPAIKLAERAVEEDPKLPFRKQCLGAVLYRAGRFDKAIETLEGIAELEKPEDTSPAYGWYFLAMAHHTNGNSDEAKKWLDKAVGWTDRVTREHHDGTGARLPWNRRATLKLLRQEAEALLKSAGASQQTDAPEEGKEEPTDTQEKTE